MRRGAAHGGQLTARDFAGEQAFGVVLADVAHAHDPKTHGVHGLVKRKGRERIGVLRSLAASRFVAQIFNLPYRRLAVGRAWDRPHTWTFPDGRQSETLRYGAAR